jgi:hypothetical protein
MQMPATDRFADWRPEWAKPNLTEMPYTPELRALYYNTAGPQDLDLLVADRIQSRQVGYGAS